MNLGTLVEDHTKPSLGRFPFEIQAMIFGWASETQAICVDFEKNSYNVSSRPQFYAMPYICRLSRQIFTKSRRLLRNRTSNSEPHPFRVWADPDKDFFFLRILLGWGNESFRGTINEDAWMMQHVAVPYARFGWDRSWRTRFEKYMRNLVHLCPEIKTLNILCHDPAPGAGLTELHGVDRILESAEPTQTWSIARDHTKEAFHWMPEVYFKILGYRTNVDELCFGGPRYYIFPTQPSYLWGCGGHTAI